MGLTYRKICHVKYAGPASYILFTAFIYYPARVLLDLVQLKACNLYKAQQLILSVHVCQVNSSRFLKEY